MKIHIKDFEKIYNETYNCTLKYILCKCKDIDNVNDLLQDTYVELYMSIKKNKHLEIDNIQNYIIGIAKNKISHYYTKENKIQEISLWKQNDDEEYEEEIPDDINLEEMAINKLNAEQVWRYVKTKKAEIIKVFYLYYDCDLKISEIAIELALTESKVKNILYRTIKELQIKFGKEVV